MYRCIFYCVLFQGILARSVQNFTDNIQVELVQKELTSLRNEFHQLKDQMSNQYGNMSNQIEDMSNQYGNMSNQIENLSNHNGNMSNQILQNGNSHTPVHFYVRLSKLITLNINSIVKFDEEVDDYGNNFNSGDGIFIAPITGFYYFSWTILQNMGKDVETELRVDNVIMGQMFGYDPDGWSAETRVAICRVKKGDHVWIQTTGYTTEHVLNQYRNSHCSFVGFLLHET